MNAGIKVYTDENVSNGVIDGLRARGVDVLSTIDAGMMGASDEEHLTRAMAEGRVLITHDQDFLRLNVRIRDHAGIVFAARHRSIGTLIARVMDIQNYSTPDDLKGNVIFV